MISRWLEIRCQRYHLGQAMFVVSGLKSWSQANRISAFSSCYPSCRCLLVEVRTPDRLSSRHSTPFGIDLANKTSVVESAAAAMVLLCDLDVGTEASVELTIMSISRSDRKQHTSAEM